MTPHKKNKAKKLDEDNESSTSEEEEDVDLENHNVTEIPLDVPFHDRIHVADDNQL